MAYSSKTVFKRSAQLGEKNDCTVKALALSTALSYDPAHALMQEQGRRKGRGMFKADWMPAYAKAGYKLEAVAGITAKTVATLPRDRKIKKSYNYIVITSGHVLAVKAGQVLDWTQGRRHRILAVYKVTKAN